MSDVISTLKPSFCFVIVHDYSCSPACLITSALLLVYCLHVLLIYSLSFFCCSLCLSFFLSSFFFNAATLSKYSLKWAKQGNAAHSETWQVLLLPFDVFLERYSSAPAYLTPTTFPRLLFWMLLNQRARQGRVQSRSRRRGHGNIPAPLLYPDSGESPSEGEKRRKGWGWGVNKRLILAWKTLTCRNPDSQRKTACLSQVYRSPALVRRAWKSVESGSDPFQGLKQFWALHRRPGKHYEVLFLLNELCRLALWGIIVLYSLIKPCWQSS